jgi:hypothetical protein
MPRNVGASHQKNSRILKRERKFRMDFPYIAVTNGLELADAANDFVEFGMLAHFLKEGVVFEVIS